MPLHRTADQEFEAALTALIPRMRAFASSLCRDPALADDLTQNALARAWKARASFTPGSNLKAWVFKILHNQFLSDRSRTWKTEPLDEAENSLSTFPDADSSLEVDELRRALMRLSSEQREALILVAVAGCGYDEAALICGCPVGTLKSRVSRARVNLLNMLDYDRARTAREERSVTPRSVSAS
jgi:RNA polymerase sigma-70 factor (ECF subfamily)